MEPNGIFLNRTFYSAKTTKGKADLEQREEGLLVAHKTTKGLSSLPQKSMKRSEAMTRSSSSSSTTILSSSARRIQQESLQPISTMMIDWEEDDMDRRQTFQHSEQQNRAYNNSVQQQEQQLHRFKNKRPLQKSEKEEQRGNVHYYVTFEDDNNNNECNHNNNNYSINTTTPTTTTTTTIMLSSSSTSSSSSSSFVEDTVKTTKKFKFKSGVQTTNSNLKKTFDDKTSEQVMQQEEEDDENTEEQGLFDLPKPSSSITSPSLLTWKLPSFLCLPFTNNDANNSYLHLMNTSSKSGILSLTSLVLVVMAVLLASVPAPVMSVAATETGESSSSIVTDDITSNDVTPHDYLTTSSSILPVKLQTISFTSHEGTTPEDSALFTSSATGRTTGLGSTHQSVEGLRQEPSVNDFAGWRDADSLTAHNDEGENSRNKGVHEDSLLRPLHSEEEEEETRNTGVHEDSLLHKEYKFKSGFPELMNETREALQEEGSNNQPVVFVGGSGYVPPNSLRTRPTLEADPSWQTRPLAEGRYPVPLQSAWDRNYRNPFNMTRVQHIEAECQDDFMKIRVAMNGSFHGLIYSSGYSYDPDCVYVNGTGRDYYEYLIKLNRCGTLGASNHVEGRREPSKNFMWNTVTVQYNPMIEEEWDEHFKVTCEYGYDFWKTVTFPFLDVEVATGNPVVFTLTPPECYMEVRYGFGTSGTRVGGPVRVGDPLTLMINMRSQYDGFDIVVNDCYAHNGATKRIQLIDHYGCPVDSKLMSPFRGTWSHTNLYETQVFAYLKTFRFTGSPALYIECDVRMCHGQCPSQPCYWRNVKSVSKRSTDNQMITDSEKNSTLSEKTSLFQALRVLQEDEDTEAHKTSLEPSESVCMKTGAFTAMIALSTFILVILTVSTMIMCFRIRRGKVIEERETAADILRPYSHHVSQHSQVSQPPPHQRHHHWSSVKPR